MRRSIVLVAAFSAALIVAYSGIAARSPLAETAVFGMLIMGAWAAAEILSDATRLTSDRKVLTYGAAAAAAAGLLGYLYFGLMENEAWLGAMVILAAAGPAALSGMGLRRLRGAGPAPEPTADRIDP